MFNYENSKLNLFFGNLRTSPFTISEIKSLFNIQNSLLIEKMDLQIQSIKNYAIKNDSMQKDIIIKDYYFLHQTHGIAGVTVSSENKKSNMSFSQEGDFLITQSPNMALGVMTADCLPVIFYDRINNITAIAHAGWKGTAQNIVLIVLEQLVKNFGVNPESLDIIFGPSAKACCYKVDEAFNVNFLRSVYAKATTDKHASLYSGLTAFHRDERQENSEIFESALSVRENQAYFDLPGYNKLLLEKAGVKNFDLRYNMCTICNVDFCSYRRNKEKTGLQITLAMLQ